MQDDPRVVIADDARELVRRYGPQVEQIAAVLAHRLRGEPVRGIRVERGEDASVPGEPGLVFRVFVLGEVEEAQHVWERIEQDLGDLQRQAPEDQRALFADRIGVVVDWAGEGPATVREE